ncbi:MAG TPA: MotA/TolQ/ExbB proton channel family protein [Candidatus Eisenbacteria bacterium]|nr:MotA/TolQ/ExbB proton channel family protein [Candidatus Eisenbacteria bacterium]
MGLARLIPALVAVDTRTSVWGLVLEAGLFAKLVLALLLVMSVISWSVIWERQRLLRRVAKADASFLRAFRGGRRLAEARLLAAQYPDSLLAKVALAGATALETSGRAAGDTDAVAIELASRAMQRARTDEMDRLERHVSFLATTGSVAPFVGLMGTVWGVMTSFLNIGAQGSASLVVVAPGIAEALIATLAGLAAAIPAVIGYNSLVARLRTLEGGASSFVTEFADALFLETSEPSASHGARPPMDAPRREARA